MSEYAIVAHDYGDTVAQELLARHNAGRSRQRLTKLVLLNGGLLIRQTNQSRNVGVVFCMLAIIASRKSADISMAAFQVAM